tara:strand:- start:2791 stop:3675 length:885 start_codon:yes stop_codon:yes gene_type:complete
MKTFKEFLSEDSGVTPIARAVIAGFIPFGQTMWERITGKVPIRMYGMHVTNQDGAEKIGKTLQKSKKQLPVTTKPDAEFVDIANSGGLLTSGGYIMIVEGDVVADFDRDVNSFRDEQGRRWVDVSKVPGFTSHIDWVNDVMELQDDITEKIDDDIGFNQIFTEGTGKQKAAAIRMYIDGVESLLSNKYRINLEDLFKNSSGNNTWNEILMSNIEVVKVLADEEPYDDMMEPVFYNRQSAQKWLKKNKMGGAKIQFYVEGDTKKRYIEEELFKIEKLNGRITLNLNKKFNFPVEY